MAADQRSIESCSDNNRPSMFYVIPSTTVSMTTYRQWFQPLVCRCSIDLFANGTVLTEDSLVIATRIIFFARPKMSTNGEQNGSFFCLFSGLEK